MKKKLTITLLLAVCAFSLVLFTACGDKPTEVIPAGHTHEYEEVVGSRIEATCHSEGSYTEKCKHCGDEKTIDIAMTAHNVAYVIDEEATCTTAGRKHGACQNQGCNYETANEVIPALGHDLGAGVAQTTPEGTTYIDQECNRCHEHFKGDITTDPEEPGEPSGSGEDK